MGKFVVKTTANGGFKFDLKAGNGEVIATSEVYASEASCLKGVASVQKNAPVAAVENQTVEGYAAEKHPKFEVYADKAGEFLLQVAFPETLLAVLPEEKREAAIGVLSHDPRPSYQRKPDRIYGLTFAGFDIRFTVTDDQLTVVEVTKA